MSTPPPLILASQFGWMSGLPYFRSLLQRMLPVVHAQEASSGLAAVDSEEDTELSATPDTEQPGADTRDDEATEKRKKSAEPLPRAPSYDSRDGMMRRVLSPHVFDGLKVDISKPISPPFAVSHSVHLGTEHIPASAGGGMYTFGAQYQTQTSFLMGRWNMDGRVDTQFIKPWNNGVTSKLIGMVVQSGYVQPGVHGCSTSVMLDTEVHGSDYTATLRVGSGPLVTLSYFQSLTPNLCIGGDGMYHHGRSIVQTSYGLRYVQPGWTVYSTLQGDGALSMAYMRKVSPRVRLATEIMMEPASRQAQVSMGAEFQLTKSRINIGLSPSWALSMVLEEKINPAVGVQISANIDHSRRAYKFGFGMSIGN